MQHLETKFLQAQTREKKIEARPSDVSTYFDKLFLQHLHFLRPQSLDVRHSQLYCLRIAFSHVTYAYRLRIQMFGGRNKHVQCPCVANECLRTTTRTNCIQILRMNFCKDTHKRYPDLFDTCVWTCKRISDNQIYKCISQAHPYTRGIWISRRWLREKHARRWRHARINSSMHSNAKKHDLGSVSVGPGQLLGA